MSANRAHRSAANSSGSRRVDQWPVARALALGTGYAAVSLVVVLVTSFGSDAGTAFWPGAGLTVAVLLSRPQREWPVLLGAVFMAEVSVDLVTGFGGRQSIAFGVANCVEPLVGAALVRRQGRPTPNLARVPDLLRFFTAAVVAGPAVGALIGTALPAVLAGDPWVPRLPRWFIGDAVGVVVIAPFLLTRPRGDRTASRWQGVRLAAAAGVAAVVAVGPWSLPRTYGLQYLLLPALVVLALRSGTAPAATSVVAVGVIIEAVTVAGVGPYAGTEGGGLLAAQMFLAVSAFTALTVAALTAGLVERERAEAVLRAQALHDSLTGLSNRRLLHERLEHALARLTRRPGLVGLICVDLDGFKAVNDQWGHAAGDAVLIETGRRLERLVREVDTVARLGGDEFLVLVEELTTAAEAADLATRLAEALREPVGWKATVLTVEASVGVALTATATIDPAELIADADRAMYRAKRRQQIDLSTEEALWRSAGRS
jgi:diguanylate cyclase (GGDEF)-like protein